MTHTKDSITALLNKNDAAVIRALRTINSVCGWTQGENDFACSLLAQMDDWEKADPRRRFPSPLSEKQVNAARKLVVGYAAVLARVANDKAKGQQKHTPRPVPASYNEPDDERWHPSDDEDGTRGRWAAEETANEIAYYQNGYHQLDW